MSASFESFEQAFRDHTSGCRRRCECGIEYWDSWNDGYDWDEGELEALQNDPKAKALAHSVGIVYFEGRCYVDGCDCWHKRAEQLIEFINTHAQAIAEFLTLEKKRKTREAETSPVVQ